MNNSYGLPNAGSAANAELYQGSGRARFHHNDAEPGIGEKVSNMFSSEKSNELPMYKDKPYNYGKGGKGGLRWLRQKRVFASLLAGLALLSWYFGILSPLSYFSSSGKSSQERSVVVQKDQSSWSLWGGGEVVAWDDRAQKVKEAFKTSFAGYEKYGWGESRIQLRTTAIYFKF
jgi:mannosyl-oligosaccharide alpha-1,2-mannosidase